jgi:ABC-type maltose transport system permease subunit
MKASEIKKLLISSLSENTNTTEFSTKLEDSGISFDFKKGFSEKVLNKIFSAGITVNKEVEFVRSMTFAFNRIALTGIAAIIILLISIFLMEGTISFNSFLGLSNSYDESIVSMLTGN